MVHANAGGLLYVDVKEPGNIPGGARPAACGRDGSEVSGEKPSLWHRR